VRAEYTLWFGDRSNDSCAEGLRYVPERIWSPRTNRSRYALTPEGRLFIVDAQDRNGVRHIVRSDDKLEAFMELETLLL
jgi:hypothetical protein